MSNLLIRRKALEGVAKGRLPSGYVEVEYIESNGTQYINTFIVPSGNFAIECSLKYTSSNNDASAFGTYSNNGTLFLTWFNNRWYFGTGKGQQSNATSISYDTYQTIKINSTDGVVQNDNRIGDYIAGGVFSFQLFLFARNFQGGVGTYSSCKMYYFKEYDATTLVRDFVPCINPQNEVGMYDLVSNTFFGNAGTGTFIAGDPV